ncbi:hypothetical protein EGW08_022105 [Elysia chlorotica]|uniref:Uncharacterized protein n=1 Tax=Elysia chlorotica TaxID=188477 RepID=A0A433SLW9_ELYCH|nr:hypothetical protein EGW08_022105 [Elysia chlorotica]
MPNGWADQQVVRLTRMEAPPVSDSEVRQDDSKLSWILTKDEMLYETDRLRQQSRSPRTVYHWAAHKIIRRNEIATVRTTDLLHRKPMFYPRATAPWTISFLHQAIYGGHISGRRLRGIKINPIYHESDAANLRIGAGKDGEGQPGEVEPVGEIQFEVYESIPPPDNQLRRQDTYQQDEEDQESFDSEEAEEEWQRRVDRDYHEYETTSSPGRDVTARKQHLRRQERINAVSSLDEDPPGFMDPVPDQVTPVTSGYSSPSSDRSWSSHNDNQSSLAHHRRHQLSVVHEQSILAEEDEDTEVLEDSGNLSSDDLYDGAYSPDTGGLDKCLYPDTTGQETCHIVTFTGGKEGKIDELFSGQEPNQNIINDYLNHRQEFSLDKDFSSPHSFDENNESSAFFSQRDKAYLSLGKISMLPSYSNIHHTSPVTSVDYMNNNYGAVPDRMLQQNGPLKEVDRYFEFIHKQSPSLHDSGEGGEEDKMTIPSLGDKGSLDSTALRCAKQTNITKNVDAAAVVKEKCDCNGRPTLKCACGRAALQKLLYEKRMVKRYEFGYHVDCSIVELSTTENVNEDEKSDTKSDKNENEDSNATKCRQPFCGKVKSILVNRSKTDESRSSSQKHSKPKTVTFHESTIFNEGKKSTYVKEGVTPGFLSALIDSLDDGYDNPVFEEDGEDIKETTFTIESEGDCGVKGGVDKSLTDDDKIRRKGSFTHPSAKNRIMPTSPLTLKVEDLNACSYMQSYLKGQASQRCDVVRPAASCECSPMRSGTHRAPPVSIEAIAGTIVVDPTFDEIKEVDEDQFEYYRRRRRRKHLRRYGGDDDGVEEWLKKTKRIKRIKITLIVAISITVIVVAIVLVVLFVGTPDSSPIGSDEDVLLDGSLDGRDINSRFSAGVLFRKR